MGMLLSSGLSLLLVVAACPAEESVDALIPQLSREQPKAVRLAAAEKLRALSEQKETLQAVEPLTQMCADKDAELREAAVHALGVITLAQQQECPWPLVEALLDPSPDVRGRNFTFLFAKFPERTAAFLWPHVDHPDPEIQNDIGMVLVRADAKNPKLPMLFESQAKSPRAILRVNAIAHLFMVTGDVARLVPHWLLLIEEMPPGEPTEKDLMTLHLAGLGAAMRLDELTEKDPKTLALALLKVLEHENPKIRRGAARSLGAVARHSPEHRKLLRQLRVAEALQKRLEDENELVADEASLALHYLEVEK